LQRGDRRCICEDADYIAAFKEKYSHHGSRARRIPAARTDKA
jgi:hypothetical protein